ncbi:MAG: hypothetical protein AAFP90_10335, partial [Planctomycetota bacterium]
MRLKHIVCMAAVAMSLAGVASAQYPAGGGEFIVGTPQVISDVATNEIVGGQPMEQSILGSDAIVEGSGDCPNGDCGNGVGVHRGGHLAGRLSGMAGHLSGSGSLADGIHGGGAAQNPKTYGRPDLFYNFHTWGSANQVNAQMYLSPQPVPAN